MDTSSRRDLESQLITDISLAAGVDASSIQVRLVSGSVVAEVTVLFPDSIAGHQRRFDAFNALISQPDALAQVLSSGTLKPEYGDVRIQAMATQDDDDTAPTASADDGISTTPAAEEDEPSPPPSSSGSSSSGTSLAAIVVAAGVSGAVVLAAIQ